MQCTNLPVEKYRFLNLFQGGGGTGPKIPRFLEPVAQFTILFELPLFKYLPKYSHISTPSLQRLITNLPRSPRLSYNYDTNMTQISYMNYSARGNAGLPSIGLEKIYCCVPCKCAFYRLVYSQNSKLFSSTIRHNLPNFPAQPSVPRVD